MKCAAWGSAGILLTCFIRGHVIKENGTVRELKISFLEKEKEVIADCAVGKYNDDTDLYIGKRPCRRSCRGRDTDSDEIDSRLEPICQRKKRILSPKIPRLCHDIRKAGE